MEFVVSRVRPQGMNANDLEVPGPGLYEIEFRVPDWAQVGDTGLSRRVFAVKVGAWRIEHRVTWFTPERKSINLRFRVDRLEAEDAQLGPTGLDETAALPAFLTFGAIVRGLAVVFGTWLATRILELVVEAVTEIRKIIEISPVLAAAVAAAIFVGLFKGKGPAHAVG